MEPVIFRRKLTHRERSSHENAVAYEGRRGARGSRRSTGSKCQSKVTFKSVKLPCASVNFGFIAQIEPIHLDRDRRPDDFGDACGVFLVRQMAEGRQADGPAAGDEAGDEVGVLG